MTAVPATAIAVAVGTVSAILVASALFCAVVAAVVRVMAMGKKKPR